MKTSDGSRWLDQAKDAPARSKSSSRLPSLCSTQPHINGLFEKPPPYYVAHRLDTPEGLKSLLRLIVGWPNLKLFYLDENHVVAALMPGEASRLWS